MYLLNIETKPCQHTGKPHSPYPYRTVVHELHLLVFSHMNMNATGLIKPATHQRDQKKTCPRYNDSACQHGVVPAAIRQLVNACCTATQRMVAHCETQAVWAMTRRCAGTLAALFVRQEADECRRFNPKSPANFQAEDNGAAPSRTCELGVHATPFSPGNFCDHAPWLDVGPGGINSKLPRKGQ